MNDAIGRRIARQREPLPRSVSSRAIAVSAVGMAVTASTLLGAGTASAAERLVVDQPLTSLEAEPGQQVAVEPSTMDSKVREAVLLAMPLDFDTASSATEQFRERSPIVLGTASEGTNSFSGSEIAQAAAPELSGIGLPDDKVDDVTKHFQRLVKLGNRVTVRVKEAAPPKEPPPSEQPPSEQPPSEQPPSEQPPSEQPSPEPTPPESREPAPLPEAPAPAPEAPPTPLSSETPTPRLAYGAPAPVRVLPPDPAQVPGFLPPYAQSAQVPQPPKPELAHPRSSEQHQQPTGQQSTDQQREQQQQEVRAAGKVEALPAERSNRVALPVLLGAISIAAVTAALVRSWILRRG